MRRVLLMSLGLVGLLAAISPAGADVRLAGTFDEHLSDAQVAGEVLVGLWLGEPVGGISLDPTRLVLPTRAGSVHACVTATTRDGEYWMHGVFLVPAGPAELGDMPINSQYKTSLAAYQLSDLGISAELRQDCNDGLPGPLVPATSGRDATTLIALVNSQRAIRTQASLQLHDTDIATGNCRRLDKGRSTAFDTICRITLPVPLGADTYALSLTRRTRAGDSEHDLFPVLLGTVPR